MFWIQDTYPAFIKPFPNKTSTKQEGERMNDSKRKEEFRAIHKHERVMLFLCFLASALIGYLLNNYLALLHV